MHVTSTAIGHHNSGKGREYMLYVIRDFCIRSVIQNGNWGASLYFDTYRVAKKSVYPCNNMPCTVVRCESQMWRVAVLSVLLCVHSVPQHTVGTRRFTW